MRIGSIGQNIFDPIFFYCLKKGFFNFLAKKAIEIQVLGKNRKRNKKNKVNHTKNTITYSAPDQTFANKMIKWRV